MSSPTDQTDGIPGIPADITASAAPNGDQKRACTNDAHEEPDGKKRRVADAEMDSKPPAAERCYVCFDVEDEAGELAVRDCSCRGGAGFAHKGCIVKFAKMNHDEKDDGAEFIEMWRECPQCKQQYQGDLAIHLANEAVAFLEGRDPSSQLRECHLLDQLLALCHKLSVIDKMPREDQNREMEGTTNKIFSITDELKKLPNTSLFDEVTTAAEAEAYHCLGVHSLGDGKSETGAKDALGYFEKSRNLYNAMGLEMGVVVADSGIADANVVLGRRSNLVDDKYLKSIEWLYEEGKKKKGEDNADVIQLGLSLAGLYQKGKSPIKAERLLSKLVDTCLRVHGAEHGLSGDAMSALKSAKARYMLITSDGEQKQFQALRYEGGGAKFVVQGPMEQPRNVDSEETLTVSSDEGVYVKGTPVIICHGFGYLTRSNREIDGKIGVALSWDGKRDSYEICFEEEGLEPRWVKRENVSILFELP